MDKKNDQNKDSINFENRKREGIVYEKTEMGDFISEEAKQRKRNIRTVSSGDSYQKQQAEKASRGRSFRRKPKAEKPEKTVKPVAQPKPVEPKKPEKQVDFDRPVFSAKPKKEEPKNVKPKQPAKPAAQPKPKKVKAEKPKREKNTEKSDKVLKTVLYIIGGLFIFIILAIWVVFGAMKLKEYRSNKNATKVEKQQKEKKEKDKNVKKNQWIEADGKRYYYGEDGMPTIGRFRLEDKIYYTNSRGAVERVVDGTKPMVALTFDDGPTDVSEDILDVLDEYEAQATFFEIGNRMDDQAAIEKRIVKQHCQIANHTYSNNLSADDSEQIADEIEKTDKKIRSYIRTTDKEDQQKHELEDNPIYVRTPEGVLSESILKAVNHPIILWTVDTLDWKTKDEEAIYYAATNDIEDGDIIGLTALKKPTARALEQIIPELESQGFQLVNVQDLVEFRGGAQNGKAYTAFPPEGGKTTTKSLKAATTEASTTATTVLPGQTDGTDNINNTNNAAAETTKRPNTTTSEKKPAATTSKPKPSKPSTESEAVEPNTSAPSTPTEAPAAPDDSQQDGED